MKDKQREGLTTLAAAAHAAGQTVFTVDFDTPALSKTSGVASWAEAVWAVESVGWVLEHWTVAIDSNNYPRAYPLFRRR